MKKLQKLFPRNQRKYYIAISLCTVTILACTYFAVITDQPLQRILEKSDIAMQQLKSYHATETITLSATSNPLQQNINLLTSDTDFISPDQVEVHITIPSDPPSRYITTSQRGKTYTRDKTGKWSVSNKSLVLAHIPQFAVVCFAISLVKRIHQRELHDMATRLKSFPPRPTKNGGERVLD